MKFFIGFLAFIIGLSTPLQSNQTFGLGSWWDVVSAHDYKRDSEFNNVRQQRAQCFKADTKKSKTQNSFIPIHTFCINPSTIRIASYNVRFWTNVFNTPTQPKILKTITAINPDIIIMEEFNAQPLKNDSWQLDGLLVELEQLGYKYGGLETLIPIKNSLSPQLGTVIFSKYPLEDIYTQYFEETLPYTSRLGYTHATVHVSDTTMSMYATHLAAEFYPKKLKYAEDVRFEQLKQMLTIIDRDTNQNVFIALDSNAVRAQDYNQEINGTSVWNLINQDYQNYVCIDRPTHARDLLEHNGFVTSFDYLGIKSPTTTNWTGMAVDAFYLHPKWQLPLTGSYVYFSDASDHYPIIMDIAVQ